MSTFLLNAAVMLHGGIVQSTLIPVEIMANCLGEQREKILSFSRTGGSFEEWINWEFFSAFECENYKVEPKPNYAKYGVAPRQKIKADLYAESEDGARKYFVEVALVGEYTQQKWIAKIEKDREKLLSLRAYDSNLVKIQILVLSASYPALVSEWDGWLSRLPFWRRERGSETAIHSPNGEIVVCAWCVET